MSTNFTAESAAKHQAELNEYLQSKNINQLFIQIVESLLIEKPEKPIAFIVEFLEKKYPEESRKEEKLEEIEKSEEDKKRIVSILENQILFRDLNDGQRDVAARAMVPLRAAEGDVVIRQGDETGEHFYVLISGSVDCFVGEELVKTYGPGSTFGELALMYDGRRAATCRASSPCKMYTLNRKAFKTIVTKTMAEKRLLAKQFLRNVDIMKHLEEHELDAVADAVREESFDEGKVICKQGEEGGNTFYIVKQGAVSCTQTDARGDEIEVAQLRVGDYFGEIALLTSKPRQATVVVAASNTKLLSIDRLTFNRILGSLEDILRSRNPSAYSKLTKE